MNLGVSPPTHGGEAHPCTRRTVYGLVRTLSITHRNTTRFVFRLRRRRLRHLCIRTNRGVSPPTHGGEAHPPHIEDSSVRAPPLTRREVCGLVRILSLPLARSLALWNAPAAHVTVASNAVKMRSSRIFSSPLALYAARPCSSNSSSFCSWCAAWYARSDCSLKSAWCSAYTTRLRSACSITTVQGVSAYRLWQ